MRGRRCWAGWASTRCSPAKCLWNGSSHEVDQNNRNEFDQVAGRIHTLCGAMLAPALALLGILLVKDKVLHSRCCEKPRPRPHLRDNDNSKGVQRMM